MCDFCRSALTFRPRDLALFNPLLLLERCSAVRYGEDNTKSTFPEQNVEFHPSFSRHGITRASSVLLIWLNENVHKRATTSPLFREKYVPLQ